MYNGQMRYFTDNLHYRLLYLCVVILMSCFIELYYLVAKLFTKSDDVVSQMASVDNCEFIIFLSLAATPI